MKNHSKIQTFILDVLFEIAGSILIAAATYNVAVYAGFPLAGFSGIALIIYRLTHLPMGAAIIILNIPVIFLCGKRIGKKFLFKTFRCMMISAVFLDYVAPLFPIYNGDRWIATLLTGTLSGIGYAVIYIRGSSTGGLDFITLYIKSLKPHMKLGTITFVLDFCIIVISGLIFKDIDGIVYGLSLIHI